MQRRPRNVIAIALIEMFCSIEHRQQHAEGGSPRLRLAFDDAPVIADDLGHQRKTQSAAGLFRRDKRIEQVRKQVLRYAGTVVLDAEFKRQRHPRFLSGYRKTNSGSERGGELNLRVAAEVDHGLGGVL